MGIPFHIRFSGSGQPDGDLVHRFRNFGEVLFREFAANGYAQVSLEEIDTATSEIHFAVASKRHLGSVTSFVTKTLQRHNLETLYRLERG